ncbi:hypothetical protein NIES22_22260 [Calothrix brevissima NIES-22]|nr:hypothetical protein NIES22_22260 [Calothrix brevissima NIES-22]
MKKMQGQGKQGKILDFRLHRQRSVEQFALASPQASFGFQSKIQNPTFRKIQNRFNAPCPMPHALCPSINFDLIAKQP